MNKGSILGLIAACTGFMPSLPQPPLGLGGGRRTPDKPKSAKIRARCKANKAASASRKHNWRK